MRGCCRVLAVVCCATALSSQLAPDQVFAVPAKARVLIFVRTDCPISNRYAPELRRIAGEFSQRPVKFWLVYSGKSETSEDIERQVSEFGLPGKVVLDAKQELATRAQATVTPQAAVFGGTGKLIYSGRIDDRWVSFGKSRPYALNHDLEQAIQATLAGKPVPHARTQAIGCYLEDIK
jgi:AhpC/TSA family